jgi:hypothetical protein
VEYCTEGKDRDWRMGKLHNEGLRNLCCSENTFRAIALWRIMWAIHVERMSGQGDLDSDGKIIQQEGIAL